MRENIGDVDANIEYVSDSQLLQFRKVVSYILGANQQLLCSRADCLGGGEVQTEPHSCLSLLLQTHSTSGIPSFNKLEEEWR